MESIRAHKKLEFVNGWSTWTLLSALCRCWDWCTPCCPSAIDHRHPLHGESSHFSHKLSFFIPVLTPPCRAGFWLVDDLLQHVFRPSPTFSPHRHCWHQNAGILVSTWVSYFTHHTTSVWMKNSISLCLTFRFIKNVFNAQFCFTLSMVGIINIDLDN